VADVVAPLEVVEPPEEPVVAAVAAAVEAAPLEAAPDEAAPDEAALEEEPEEPNPEASPRIPPWTLLGAELLLVELAADLYESRELESGLMTPTIPAWQCSE
jgi:hypothetical protein